MAAGSVAGAVVVDWGTFSMKAGLSTHSRPHVVVEAVGAEADIAERWRKVLEGRLAVDVKQRPVLVGVPVATPRRVRDELCQVLFESLGAPEVFIGSTAFFSVLGAGLSTALVLDVGEAGTVAVPVEEGHPRVDCTAHAAIGGARLSASMAELMRESGYELHVGSSNSKSTGTIGVNNSESHWWLTAGRVVKERLGYVALDFAKDLRQVQSGEVGSRRCELPGGGIFVSARGEGFRCAELLFGKSVKDYSSLPLANHQCGIDELLINSLRLQSNIPLRGRLLENVLLVGGSSMFTGLPERLLHELRLLSPWVAPGKKVTDIFVHAPAERDLLTWRGGATLADCDVVRQLCTSRADYDSQGPSVVHRTFI